MVETCFGSSKFPRFIDFLQQVGSEVWCLVCRDFFWNTHPCKHLYQIIINLAGFNSSACPQEWHTKGHLNGLSLNGLTLLLLVIGKLCLGPLVLFPFPPPDLPTITETELGFPVMYPFFLGIRLQLCTTLNSLFVGLTSIPASPAAPPNSGWCSQRSDWTSCWNWLNWWCIFGHCLSGIECQTNGALGPGTSLAWCSMLHCLSQVVVVIYCKML